MYITRVHRLEFSNYDLLIFILENSTDPDEMRFSVTLHLGLQCLPKYPFRGFPLHKGLTLCILETPNSEDPDEMPHNAAFNQGLHYLQRLK